METRRSNFLSFLMVWDVIEDWLKSKGGKVSARQLNQPKLTGGLPNPGYAG